MTYAYALDAPHSTTLAEAKALVGGKAANLGVMARELGLPVPPGFVITTAACRTFLAEGWPDGLDDELRERMARDRGGRRPTLRRPVRPAARERPLGCAGVDARDDGHDPRPRPERRHDRRPRPGVGRPGVRPRLPRAVRGELPLDRRRRRRPGRPVGPAPRWRSKPCSARGTATAPGPTARKEGIPDDLGTAVTVQAMVFGNRGADLGHRRAVHPQPGDRRAVAVRRRPVRRPGRGRRRRHPPHRADRRPRRRACRRSRPTCARTPTASSGTSPTCATSSSRSRTAGSGCSRSGSASGARRPRCGSRSTWPTIRRSRCRARRRSSECGRCSLEPPTVASLHASAAPPLARGLPASPGIASGPIATDPEAAQAAAETGPAAILVRAETSPDDVHGMARAAGILTSRGGLASHAAVVARGWGIPAVVGAGEVDVRDGRVGHRRADAAGRGRHHDRRDDRRGVRGDRGGGDRGRAGGRHAAGLGSRAGHRHHGGADRGRTRCARSSRLPHRRPARSPRTAASGRSRSRASHRSRASPTRSCRRRRRSNRSSNGSSRTAWSPPSPGRTG